jgi:hypothetical protein
MFSLALSPGPFASPILILIFHVLFFKYLLCKFIACIYCQHPKSLWNKPGYKYMPGDMNDNYYIDSYMTFYMYINLIYRPNREDGRT